MDDTPLLELADIALVRQGRTLVSRVDLALQAGECVVVAGPSGAGKSTLLAVLSGEESPAPGARRIARGGIGFLTQDPALFDFDGLTVRENLDLVLERHGKPATAAPALLAQVGLGPELLERRPSELSGGQRRRVGIARALAADPQVLLYDEPTAGLDPVNVDRIAALIRDVCLTRKTAALVVTHDPRVAALAADRVLFLTPEGLVPVLDPATIREARAPVHEAALAGLETALSRELHARLAAATSPVASARPGEGVPAGNPLVGALEALGRTAKLLVYLPAGGRRGATLGRLARLGPGAMVTTAVASFAVGLVVMLQSQAGLARFEATHLLPEVALGSLVREVLPLVNGLLLAGRMGSSISSEIGVITQSGQTVALHLLGLSPGRLLVGPLLRASLMIFPMAVLAGALGGLAGARLGAVSILGLNESLFLDGAHRALAASDFMVAAGKAMLFGVLVALAALRWGLTPKDGTREVGEHTTRAVVEASFLVVLADLLVTRVITA